MRASESKHRADGGGAAFAPTLWTMVLNAGQTDTDGVAAFGRLAQTYWYPVYAFIRRKGYAHADAEDLTQAFFVLLQEKRALAGVHPDKGRFRAFMLTVLRRFLISEWHRTQAQRRGGGIQFVALDREEHETRFRQAAPAGDPDKAYDRDVALALLCRTMARLGEEYEQAGRGLVFAALRPHLTGERDLPDYESVAAALGMTSAAVKMAVMRLRRRFGVLLRDHVAQIVADPALVEGELRHLVAAMSP